MKKKQESLGKTVYQYLLDQILEGQIKPGDKIPEARIASEFGISRTPIRDALKLLANDGIVSIYPNRHAEVAHWDEETTHQIGIVRIQLDLLAVKLAVLNASNADFIEMFQHSVNCLEAAKQNNIALRIKEDCAFHLDLSRISKNKQLLEFQRKIYLKIEFLQSWRPSYLELPEEQHRQHEEIIRALMDRDEKKAAKLISQHHVHFHNLEKKYPIGLFLNDDDPRSMFLGF